MSILMRDSKGYEGGKCPRGNEFLQVALTKISDGSQG